MEQSPLSRPGSARRPALLPAFEPTSSSPPGSRSQKRKFVLDDTHVSPTTRRRHQQQQRSRKGGISYPTPVPTSSTGILTSSSPNRGIHVPVPESENAPPPQQLAQHQLQPRRPPPPPRTLSTASERAPLSDLPTVMIPASGDPLLLGRSSNSCHFQLPYNRLISRVHVSVTWEPPTSPKSSNNSKGSEEPCPVSPTTRTTTGTVVHISPSKTLSPCPSAASAPAGRVTITCLGWNGCKVLSSGRTHPLERNESFVSTNPTVDMLLDVQDTRVMLAWPFSDRAAGGRPSSFHSDSTWDEGSSPARRAVLEMEMERERERERARRGRGGLADAEAFASSPPQLVMFNDEHALRSPVSPSPARFARHGALGRAGKLSGTCGLDSSPSFLMSHNLPTNAGTCGAVQVYEDPVSDREVAVDGAPELELKHEQSASPSIRPPLQRSTSNTSGGGRDSTDTGTTPNAGACSFSSVSSLSSVGSEIDLSGENEENDPIVHSFGPYGSNILSRLGSFSATSPQAARHMPHGRASRGLQHQARNPLAGLGVAGSVTSPMRPPPSSILGSSPRKLGIFAASSPVKPIPAATMTSTATASGPSPASAAVSAAPVAASLLPGRTNISPIKNHVINQLAFSRVHSIPLSAILGALPPEFKQVGNLSASGSGSGSSIPVTAGGSPASVKNMVRREEGEGAEVGDGSLMDVETEAEGGNGSSSSGGGSATVSASFLPALTHSHLHSILSSIPCVGEISRSGKDAAGKALENEFYYVPERDDNAMRRQVVQGMGGKTGLRAVRRNHKQYYWKRPRH